MTEYLLSRNPVQHTTRDFRLGLGTHRYLSRHSISHQGSASFRRRNCPKLLSTCRRYTSQSHLSIFLVSRVLLPAYESPLDCGVGQFADFRITMLSRNSWSLLCKFSCRHNCAELRNLLMVCTSSSNHPKFSAISAMIKSTGIITPA